MKANKQQRPEAKTEGSLAAGLASKAIALPCVLNQGILHICGFGSYQVMQKSADVPQKGWQTKGPKVRRELMKR